MAKHLQWSIEDHTGACPTHDLPHMLTLERSVAMAGTTFASRFLILPTAMIQTVLTIIDQRLMLIIEFLLMKPMTAIEPDHILDCAFFSVNNFSHNAVLFY